jgi:hypothetical protein
MALTEENAEEITVTIEKEIHVKTVTRILRDGVEVSASIHRGSFLPGDEVHNQSATTQSIAALVWTPEVIEARRLKALEDAANIGGLS